MSEIARQKQAVFDVGFLLLDGFSMLTYSAAAEPLRAANEISGKRLYRIWNIPAQGARALASCGSLIPANAHVGERLGYDLVLVVASNDGADAKQPRLLDWLRQLDRRKILLGGLAAGPLMLVRAGLMKGRKMTLHWHYQNMLAETHPSTEIQQQLFVIDQDRMTCAGGTGPVDLMLAFIAEQHSRKFSRQVNDWWSHPESRPAEAPQRSGLSARYGTHNVHVIELIQLMENHLSDPIDLTQLAQAAEVSERQVNRLFKRHIDRRPMDFYRRLRLGKSYELLTQTSMSVSDVVVATGFTSHSHFSRGFKQLFNMTPSEARASLGEQGALSPYAIAAGLAWDSNDRSRFK